MSEPLHLKYRPQSFTDVRGQDRIVASLEKLVKTRGHHSFLFTGPSGTGKTTLARIVMQELGCSKFNLLEVNAAVNTGIDAMRAVTESLHYAPMGNSKARGIVLDEAHALSKQAWQSLLKLVEEPPAHVFWALCTTEPAKVPATIRTRCACYELKPLRPTELEKLLVDVAKREKLSYNEDVLALISERSNGSPRQALVYLAQVGECDDPQEAAGMLQQLEEGSVPVLELCRALSKGERDWGRLARHAQALADENPEGVRLQVQAYFTKVMLGAKSKDSAGIAMEVLDAFSDPYPPANNCAPLLLSLGRLALS